MRFGGFAVGMMGGAVGGGEEGWWKWYILGNSLITILTGT